MTPEEIEIANALRYLATDDAALEFAVDRIMRRWDEIIIMDAARDTVKRWSQKRAPTARGRVERPKATNHLETSFRYHSARKTGFPSMSDCNCHKCREERAEASGDSIGWHMEHPLIVTCPECGNKRCPKATNHRHACTGSNDPGRR